MRIVIILTMFFLTPTAWAADYYVKNAGDDTKDGLSEANAWKTISKVNSTLPAGNTGNFNRGDVWREQLIPRSGSVASSTTYTAYGTGAKPLFLGSVEENDAGDWTDLGGNIWSNDDADFDREVGNLIFNGEASVGVNVALEASVNVQGEFWYDATNDLIKLYSVGNPATFYTDIECALAPPDATHYFVNVQNRNYVIIENIDVRYFGINGIGGVFTANINVRDCDLSYGGGDWDGGRTLRKGNAVQWWGNADGNVVERCRIDNMYDAAVTDQSTINNSIQQNLVYRNNKISNCEFSYESWQQGTGQESTNISFVNNTCLYAGSGWGHNQRPGAANGRHLSFYTNQATNTNVAIKSNIFYESTESAIRWQRTYNVDDYILDYNSFYESAGNVVEIQNGGSTYTFAQFANYQSDTGQDANSIDDNPLLGSNYTLNTSSPCISAGVLTLDVQDDFRQGSRRSDYDIGAYAYNSVIKDCLIKDSAIE